MKTVWKYALDHAEVVLELPEHKIIHVGYDGTHTPCFWAEVDPDSPKKAYAFRIYGTGHKIENDNQTHIGTMIAKSGFVWHAYKSDV